jgi:hypothetical protein
MRPTYFLGIVAVMISTVLTTVVASPSPTAVKDGWYNASVQYRDSRVRGPQFYKLNVRIESDRIVAIDLGNGETVHAGANNSGYTYSGGRITTEKDWTTGRVMLVKSIVKVVAKDGHTLKFDIKIGYS